MRRLPRTNRSIAAVCILATVGTTIGAVLYVYPPTREVEFWDPNSSHPYRCYSEISWGPGVGQLHGTRVYISYIRSTDGREHLSLFCMTYERGTKVGVVTEVDNNGQLLHQWTVDDGAVSSYLDWDASALPQTKAEEMIRLAKKRLAETWQQNALETPPRADE